MSFSKDILAGVLLPIPYWFFSELLFVLFVCTLYFLLSFVLFVLLRPSRDGNVHAYTKKADLVERGVNAKTQPIFWQQVTELAADRNRWRTIVIGGR